MILMLLVLKADEGKINDVATIYIFKLAVQKKAVE